ncbi:MAG: DUF1993 domain-containing protein [Steroidobacteraceae bacterium]
MPGPEIAEIRRIFLSRLDTLGHILDVGAKHLDLEAALQQRLAPDMFPLGAQIAFACNQPRGFAQWCAGQPVKNLAKEVDTVQLARAHIGQTRELVAGIDAGDARLDEDKRVGMGPDLYCVLPARQYVNDYLMPNLYFHITTTYAILRKLGVPLGKADFLVFLAPHIRPVGDA